MIKFRKYTQINRFLLNLKQTKTKQTNLLRNIGRYIHKGRILKEFDRQQKNWNEQSIKYSPVLNNGDILFLLLLIISYITLLLLLKMYDRFGH